MNEATINAMATAKIAAMEAQRLADWKEGGRVKATAEEAARRAQGHYLDLVEKYQAGGIHG